MINLEKLVGAEMARKMATVGLDKLASARLSAEGYEVPESLDLPSAIRVLGERLYTKNAEFKEIIEGLVSLDRLVREG